MRLPAAPWHPSAAIRLAIAVALFLVLACRPGHAERSTFRIYAADQGLTNLGGGCVVQDRAGYLLVCTEHGVFAYDGRRFINLDHGQGLRSVGRVFETLVSGTGLVAVRFADELFVSDRPSDASHAPTSLSFKPLQHAGIDLYDVRPHQLASWHDGFVMLAADTTERVVTADGASHLESFPYSQDERTLLRGAVAVFAIQGALWETFEDGRLCAAEPGAVRCYGPVSGLHGGPWFDVAAAPGGQIYARSATAVGALEPSSGQWVVTELPDQGGRYEAHASSLALFKTPDGRLMTQADHGLAVLRQDGWHVQTVEEGAPAGTIVWSMVDSTGQFWFQVFGRGLVRWMGFGHWEAVQKAEGLSEGLPWQTARAPGGPLWISTDTGVDEVMRVNDSPHVTRVYPGASFAIAAGPRDLLWRSARDGIRIIDPKTGAERGVHLPAVEAILPCLEDGMLVGTQAGLYQVFDRPGAAPRAILQGSPRIQVAALLCDGSGGAFYLAAGRLRHRHADGADARVAGDWPPDGFDPISFAAGPNGTIWVGGSGGLYLLTLSGDEVTAVQAVPQSDIRINLVSAVMVDHRGWVWAGTSQGVSVFNGRRWVSVDADGGLVSDDVDEGGLREDPDGSVWITTTQGVSHLLDPLWLFEDSKLKSVISSALLGGRPVVGRQLPYTRDALTLQFGTPDYAAERSVLFRYSLSGVDGTEAESATGLVRYAFVPPGIHLLRVVAYDTLTHRTSAPACLVIDVAYPWWRRWWSEAFWGLAVIALAYGAMRLRFSAMRAREAELRRRVALATEQLRYDRLTGLLNRSEIESRLADKLSHRPVGDEMVVALLDIDHFKRVNDSYGHLGGDDVLRAIGRLVAKTIWDGEYAGRYGGEEILLVLDDTDGRGAERVLELLHAVRGSSFNAAGRAVRITCSIGLAWAAYGDDWESLIGRADDALYEAKSSGRDQVVERPRGVPVVRSVTNDRRSAG